MSIKRSLFSILILIGISSTVNAQIHGLSVLDTADQQGKGTMHILAGGFDAENASLYGGRFAYGATDRLLVFTDLGVQNDYRFDPEFLGQAGMRYTLPVNLPFDLAIRSTAIPFISSYEHYFEITFGLLASKYLDSDEKWAVYHNIGLDRQWWELEVALDPAVAAFLGTDTYVDKGNKTDVTMTTGISRKLSGSSRFFIEAAKIDVEYFCAGIRFEL
ncbi:hypothetical protein ACFL6K_03405 [Candidatus Latescibacterota bacterium]